MSMPARRPAIADLGDPAAVELLEQQPLVRVGYTGPDGFPRVIPVGFLWRDGKVIICTAPTSPKVSALRARPQVALTIDTEQPPNRALFIRGVASIEVVDGVPDEYLAAAKMPMSTEERDQFEKQVRSLYRQMARISIEPRWARYYDFTTGRMPQFLLELVADQQPG
jgi:Pyridoxamine 5'-phosphate oxidase